MNQDGKTAGSTRQLKVVRSEEIWLPGSREIEWLFIYKIVQCRIRLRKLLRVTERLVGAWLPKHHRTHPVGGVRRVTTSEVLLQVTREGGEIADGVCECVCGCFSLVRPRPVGIPVTKTSTTFSEAARFSRFSNLIFQESHLTI